ncbi:DUF2570 domain-containing protein [Enterobacteriaceae bacterium RIT711]|nr:DUF2570 domain-containing protein [Enterobacteriaceae bacterium RIT711]
MLREAIAKHWRAILGALLIMLLVVTAKIAISNYDRAIAAESSIESTVMVTKNVITAMNLINDISKAAREEKQNLAEKGASHVVYIRQTLQGDPCANQPVPVAASDSLQQLKDNVRTGTSSADKR